MKDHIRHKSGALRKTICTCMCMKAMGVPISSFYHCTSVEDMSRILNERGYGVWKQDIDGMGNVHQLQGYLRGEQQQHAAWYLVELSEHVLLLDAGGHVVCDTDPRPEGKADRRRLMDVYKVQKWGENK